MTEHVYRLTNERVSIPHRIRNHFVIEYILVFYFYTIFSQKNDCIVTSLYKVICGICTKRMKIEPRRLMFYSHCQL